MRDSLALSRSPLIEDSVSPEVECTMRKVLILSAMALALSAQAATAHPQGKGPGVDNPDSTVASDHSNGSKKEQPKAKSDSQTSDQSASQETVKPAQASTASVTTMSGEAGPTGATSDGPIKTTPAVPVSGPVTSSSADAVPAPAGKDAAAKSDAATVKSDAAAKPNPAASAPSAATAATPLPTSIYRVGVGDVLDIRLLNAAGRESTLFTVMPGGLLEYPLAGAPLQVAGLTTDEIASRLKAGVKVYDNPQFVVGVREYMSHNAIVTGLVNNPGPRVLRREAMPLYVVLAEAQPRPEAARASIMRGDSQTMLVDLADSSATSTLVQSGDVIKVMAAPPAAPQFYFIGGQVNAPGQKDFHAGLTLTQAILASGGASRFAGGKVKVSRQGADGRLVMTEYNLKQIEDGKVPDPALQPGDRIEVGRGHW